MEIKKHIKTVKDKTIDYVEIKDHSLNQTTVKPLKDILYESGRRLEHVVLDFDTRYKQQVELNEKLEKNIITLKENEQKLVEAIKSLHKEIYKIKRVGGFK